MWFINHVKRNYKLYIVSSFFLLFILCIWSFIYKDHIKQVAGVSEAISRQLAGNRTLELQQEDTYRKTLTLADDEITILHLAFDSDKTDPNALIQVSFGNSNTGQVLESWNVQPSDFQQEYTGLSFSDPVKVNCDTDYYISVSLLEGKAVSLYLASGSEDTIAYQIHGNPSNSVYYVYLFVLFGIFLLLLMAGISIAKKWKCEIYFSVCAFVVGLIMIVLIPPYFTPDEEYHFTIAYAESSELMGKEAVNSEGQVLVRRTDYDYYIRYQNSGGVNLTRASYRAEVKGLLSNNDDTMSEDYHMQTKGGASALNYIPETLGITIARLLHFNGAMLFMAGRISSLLVYIIIMFFAIKIMPFAKMALCVVGMFPMTMELVASYNYDAIILPVSFFSIAYILYLAYEADKIKIKDFIILGVMVCILCITKYLYMILFVMGLIIPKEKFGSGKKKAYMAAGILIIGTICILGMNLQSVENFTSVEVQQASWIDEPKFSFSYILTEPLEVLEIFLRTIIWNYNYYFGAAIGRSLGWLNFGISETLLIGFVFLFFFGTLKKYNDGIPEVRISTRICTLFCIGLTSIAIFMGLFLGWTRVSSIVVEGIQGRYFLPLFPLLILILQNKTLVLKRHIDYEIMAGITLLQIFVFAEIFRGALSQ